MAVRLCTRSFFVNGRLYEHGISYDVELGPEYRKFFDPLPKTPKAPSAEGPDLTEPLALSQIPIDPKELQSILE